MAARGGTPKDRLESMVSVRLNPREAKAIRAAAERNGLTVSSYIRRAALTTALPISGPLAAHPATVTTSVGLSLSTVGDRLVSKATRAPKAQPSTYSEATE